MIPTKPSRAFTKQRVGLRGIALRTRFSVRGDTSRANSIADAFARTGCEVHARCTLRRLQLDALRRRGQNALHRLRYRSGSHRNESHAIRGSRIPSARSGCRTAAECRPRFCTRLSAASDRARYLAHAAQLQEVRRTLAVHLKPFDLGTGHSEPGGFGFLNLQQPPFSLPLPLLVMPEEHYASKAMCLWDMTQIGA
jgi:hypothetical protein